MKKHNLLYPALFLLVLSACKKDNNENLHPIDPVTPQIEAVKDSASFSIDGKTYVANTVSSDIPIINQFAHQKIDFFDGDLNKMVTSHSPDSIMFSRDKTVISAGTYITLTVEDIFNKVQLSKDAIFYHLSKADLLKLYATGKHPFAEDYGRENTQSGVAILLSFGDGNYSSYIPLPIQTPTSFGLSEKFDI